MLCPLSCTNNIYFINFFYNELNFFREDGTFVISNIPSGSYIVEVVNPNYFYEPVRVEINSKGKFRARKVNLIQTSQIIQVPYPLKMRPLSPFRYFQVREQWRVTDFLFNPMVIVNNISIFICIFLYNIIIIFALGFDDDITIGPNYDST